MIDPYATHIYPLVVCAANTSGPIFEHGCGHYSTPILRAVAPLREIVCLEHDATFRDSLSWLPGVTWVTEIPDTHFGFAFVDGAPAETRVTVCNKVDASIILLHDVEKPKYYRLINLRPFRYKFTFKVYTKWTMAMSDTIDVQAFLQSHISDIDQQEIPLKPLPLPV